MDKKTLGQYFTVSVLTSVRMRVEYFSMLIFVGSIWTHVNSNAIS